MIHVESVQHVSVNVTDLGRARQFYTGILGLAEIVRPDFDFSGAWFGAGAQQIHLIVHPGARTLRGTTEIDTRDAHVALRVASYQQTLEHLRALGVVCVERPRNQTPWSQIYIADPDGNIIELNAERVDCMARPSRANRLRRQPGSPPVRHATRFADHRRLPRGSSAATSRTESLSARSLLDRV